MRSDGFLARLVSFVESGSFREEDYTLSPAQKDTLDTDIPENRWLHSVQHAEKPVGARLMSWFSQKGFELFRDLYRIASVFICVTLIGVLLSVVSFLPAFGSAENPAVNEVVERYVSKSIEETGATNAVAGMISAYRGVLRRPGHTEAAIDLARLAGLKPAGALIEVMNEDGTMARLPQLVETARKFGLKIISIASLIEYRLREESIVERGVTVPLPTAWGDFQITPFRQKSNGVEHVALTKGTWREDEPVLIRVHSSCATGDIFGSYRCDCGDQLHRAMQMIEQEGRGAIVYLNQEGRGIGLCNKIRAYQLQDEGLDTVDANIRLGFRADERDYGVGASIIRELGIRRMRLMTNNPSKKAGLEGYGLRIEEIVPIVVEPNPYNERYLETKQKRMHHTLGLEK